MALTLKEAITATQTTIDVNGTDALSNGDLYAIEGEQVFIVTASAGSVQPGETAWQRLGVQRGSLGTTETAHAAGTSVTLVSTPLGAGGGGSGALTDPGNVWEADHAYEVGDRILVTIHSLDRVFEVSTAGTTLGSFEAGVFGNDDEVDLNPLALTPETDPAEPRWRYLGIVGELPWTVVPKLPPEWSVASGAPTAGSLTVQSDRDAAYIRVRANDDPNGTIDLSVADTGGDITAYLQVEATGSGQAQVAVIHWEEGVSTGSANILGSGAIDLFTEAGVKAFTAWDGEGNVLRFALLPAGQVMTAVTTAPADGDLSASQVALWFDDTDGAAKLMVKGKTANGTVRTGSVNLT